MLLERTTPERRTFLTPRSRSEPLDAIADELSSLCCRSDKDTDELNLCGDLRISRGEVFAVFSFYLYITISNHIHTNTHKHILVYFMFMCWACWDLLILHMFPMVLCEHPKQQGRRGGLPTTDPSPEHVASTTLELKAPLPVAGVLCRIALSWSFPVMCINVVGSHVPAWYVVVSSLM